MDFAAQQAIDACGYCSRPERDHQVPAEENADQAAAILFALGGGEGSGVACAHYVISDAALAYQRHLAIANGRAGRRQPQRCGRCGQRGHKKESCPL